MVLFPLPGQCKDFKILKPHLPTSYTLLLSCTLIFFYLLWPLWEIILYSLSFRFIYTCIILFFLFISSYISEPLSWIIFLLPKECSVLPFASDNFPQLFFSWEIISRLFRKIIQRFAFVVQLLSHVGLFVTPWTAACQASLSFTISWSLFKLMSIESVMPSNLLILCRPLLFLPSIFPSIRVFPSESALCIRDLPYWISIPSLFLHLKKHSFDPGFLTNCHCLSLLFPAKLLRVPSLSPFPVLLSSLKHTHQEFDLSHYQNCPG